MPLDGGQRTTLELAEAIVSASSLIHETAKLNRLKHYWPHFQARHKAYASITSAYHEAVTSGRKAELCETLKGLGYASPVGRACKLFGLNEVYP